MAEGKHSTSFVIAAGVAGLLIGLAIGYSVANGKFNADLAKVTADAQARLAQANAEVAKANAEIAKANTQAQALALRDLPLRVTFRKALLGGGFVAALQNFGSKELELKVTAKSTATNQTKEWRIVLAPNAGREIGPREGWSWAAGDVLEVFEEGYRPSRYTFTG